MGDAAKQMSAARLRDNPVTAWSVAVAMFLAALGTRFLLEDQVPYGIPYLTFFPAVIMTAFLAGLRPSIAVGVASALAAFYFFLPPYRSFALQSDTVLSLGLFATVVAVDIAVIHFMYRALDALRAEKAHSAELAEQRELLFRELQHRVSNNLGVVSALLNLQRSEVTDEKAKQALTEAATRLALISKIHRKLHDPASAGLRLGPFMEELCHDVLEASGAKSIVCLVSAVETTLPSDKAVPFALIVAELISNALEHGFADQPRGTIRVDLAAMEAEHVLTISDDGKGLPEGFSVESAADMGLRIVQSLAQQLNGRFSIEEHGAGTTCRLTFQP